MNNKSLLDFLVFSYFGISSYNAPDEVVVIKKCINRAYKDMASHTLVGLDDNTRANARSKASDYLFGQIRALLSEYAGLFDEWHCLAAHGLISIYPDGILKYGQAQKWINTTLKYLYLFSCSDYIAEDCILIRGIRKWHSMLHAPIDGYVIEALWEEEALWNTEEVKSLLRKNKNGRYSNEKVKPWSSWNEIEYRAVQKWIRNNKGNAVEWEHETWIRIASRRR